MVRNTINNINKQKRVYSLCFLSFLLIVSMLLSAEANAESEFQKPVVYFDLDGVTSQYSLSVGQQFDAKVMVANARGVNALTLNITYSTETIRVLDSNPDVPGVNIGYRDGFDLVHRNGVYEGQIYFSGFSLTGMLPDDDPLHVATIRCVVVSTQSTVLYFNNDPHGYAPVSVLQIKDDSFDNSIPVTIGVSGTAYLIMPPFTHSDLYALI